MPVMERNLRNLTELAKKLESLGIDAAIVALATGAAPHAAFCYRCEAVDDPKVENGGEPPRGPPFTTLWECCDSVTGFWIRDGGIEFIEFDIEHPEDADWDDAEAALARLREAARVVGFVHLDEVLRIQEAGSTEQYLAFARSL
jgi:hypothetical protein